MITRFDTVILGAGAAGLFCASKAAETGKSTLVIDHADKPGEKIRISGGGRCNFTNINCTAENFYSCNPHFAKSALSRFQPPDFLRLVERYHIAWHEKTLGQLFCDGSSRQIIEMLLNEIQTAGADLWLSTEINEVTQTAEGFRIHTSGGEIRCESLVIATGGKSIPKMGATGFGYKIAEQFGIKVVETRPALVPLTFDQNLLADTAPLAGIGIQGRVCCHKFRFDEALLFTHRGLSGPAILQISAVWREGDAITVDLLPHKLMPSLLDEARRTQGKKSVKALITDHLPARLAEFACDRLDVTGTIADQPTEKINRLCGFLNGWTLKPAGSEGYRTAEVTLGGVDTDELSGKTMQSKKVPGLYFIGEVVDVTGWLGGYNFQWAWASAFAAGRHIAQN